MSRPARLRGRSAAAPTAAAAVLLTAVLATVAAVPAAASSHREAPLIAADPAVDNTDVYAFVSPDEPDTVTFVANWFGLQEPNGGPTFYPWATDANYDINIDTDGNAKPDVGYRLTFRTDDRRGNDTFLYNDGPVESLDDENLLFRQHYTLSVSKGGDSWEKLVEGQVAPSQLGAASIPDYATLRDQAIKDVPGGGQVYVGAAEDPFFADLRVFDLLYGGDLSEVGQDTLAGTNVNTWALQVPISEVTANGDPEANPVIGVWSDTERRTLQLAPGTAKAIGDPVQVSRLGNPLVNEVVLPAGLKDAFNGLTPVKDATIPEVVDRVTDPELARLLEAIYNVPAPDTPRNDLVEIFLTGIATNAPTLDGTRAPIQADLNSQVLNADTDPEEFQPSEMLRLNTSITPTAEPNRLGVLADDLQGFPNGRRLTDDIIDISVQAVAGAAQSGTLVDALAAGDGVDTNDVAFLDEFPYVALPGNETRADSAASATEPSSTDGGDTEGASTPTESDSWVGDAAFSSPMMMPIALGGGLGGALLATSVVLLAVRRRGRPAPSRPAGPIAPRDPNQPNGGARPPAPPR